MTLRVLCVLPMLALISTSAPALQLRTFSAATHLRFSSGYPAAPVANATFLAATHDLSGVGWNAANGSRSYTLISPQHFVGANHIRPGIGGTVVFRGRDEVLRTYTIAALHTVTNQAGEATDLFIGELSAPIETCDEITYYPVLDLTLEAEYVGLPLLVYGKTARMGRGTIAAFQDFGADPITGSTPINTTRVYTFLYNNLGGSSDDCFFENGDSGSPSFVSIDDELYLVGMHTAVLTTTGGSTMFDTFVPHYLDQLDDVAGSDGWAIARAPDEAFTTCFTMEAQAPNNITIEWSAVPGRAYAVESSSNYTNYTMVGESVTATSTTASVLHTSAVEKMLVYRLLRLPLP